MPPQESDSLLKQQQQQDNSKTKPQETSSIIESSYQQAGGGNPHHLSLDPSNDDDDDNAINITKTTHFRKSNQSISTVIMVVVVAVVTIVAFVWLGGGTKLFTNNLAGTIGTNVNRTGPYQLIEIHHGKTFLDYYDFADGPDSLGSAGYNTYVSKDRAQELGLFQTEEEDDDDDIAVLLKSAAGTTKRDVNGNRFRESIRLEGKKRLDRGLIVLDVRHMPAGCGVWPAFWTTDETHWPDHGEIDIVEGINNQDVVKTALHTSDQCSMYAHVPRWAWSGEWDTATGLPDTFTGRLNFDNRLEADNCWVMAPHQWANQGCVAVSQENGTIGTAMNDVGGGVYVLEWDPDNGYIRSWVFQRHNIPTNLLESMQTANDSQQHDITATTTTKTKTKNTRGDEKDDNDKTVVLPDPSTWGLPYAYFAIGQGSGCSADHFVNHHIVINLAFCGTVAGNRFQHDCPALYEQYNVHNDSELTCNAYIDSDPTALKEAYWKIRGVYIYQRQ
ncbi:glycosyl hydrolase family 16 protein [Nitzschia inconspicua]|uniref:Glycosyl hydrolase family 16 protein n=1 Tax=Nitzschia inconspicua TaxID=303405 RepID=A0A9K3P7D6_9STRA|nr:glycosyl hydrolase family 16 protein [Nitzschia inconspicua]KAG7344699.1 glycosyl hydrolase family 16 protein [Nitzschia inconspicua]KAG7370403.1 glycosyl hydrolase family 16 protein [Nitzschia inconspicua]